MVLIREFRKVVDQNEMERLESKVIKECVRVILVMSDMKPVLKDEKTETRRRVLQAVEIMRERS